MRERKQLGIFFLLGGSLLFGQASSSPTVVTATYTGSFANNGQSSAYPGNTHFGNYSAGWDPVPFSPLESIALLFRNFFVFNLSNVSGTITSASLDLYMPASQGYLSFEPSEPYQVTSSSTGASEITGVFSPGSADGMTIFNTLGTATVFASTTVSAATQGTTVHIALNAAGLAFLNSNEGQTVVLSGQDPSAPTSGPVASSCTGTCRFFFASTDPTGSGVFPQRPEPTLTLNFGTTGASGGTTILFNALNGATEGADSIAQYGPLYQSFSTGASPAALSDVMVKLGVTNLRSSGGSIAVALYSDAGVRPGPMLVPIGTVADTSLPTSQQYQNFDFPLSQPFTLSPNTMYWIGLSTSSASVAAFAYTNDTSGVGVAMEYLYYNAKVYRSNGDAYQMQITSTTPSGPAPTLTSVVDQAAGTTNLTPGMPISVTGTGFGTSSTDAATVMIGTEAAPVLSFASPTNLIVQVPVDASLGPATLTVNYKGQPSTAFNIKLVALAPEIQPAASANGSAFYDASGNPITSAHPAQPASQVYCLAIGLGTTSPAQVTDTVATLPALTTQQVQVMVGTEIVQPTYAGLDPGGTPGYYQVLFTVPADAPTLNQSVTLVEGGLTSNAQTLAVAPPVPVINAIVNGATFAPGPAPQAANSFVSLFGANFGSENTNGNIFPAMTFNGLSVLVNGTAIPLYVVAGTGGQINVVLPSELGTSGNASVEVMTASGTSQPFQLALTADSVGIFRIADPSDASRHNGAVLFTNTAWKVMPLSMAQALGLPSCSTVTTASVCGQPAKAGDQVEIYLTGLGKATQNGDPNGKVLPTGSLAPTNGSVLYKTVEPPKVKIGGVDAAVSFSGIAPGNAGQYQINVQVPSGVTPGDNVTLTVTMPDGSTDTVTIAITGS